MLGLGHDPPFAAPAVEGGIGEVVELAGRLAGCGVLGLGAGKRFVDLGHQAGVAGEAEDVADAIIFAPAHQLVAGEAKIRPQQDLDPGPALTDLGNDACDLLRGAGGGVDIRAPELGGQQVAAAEDIQRQVAVAVIVAVEEAPFLVAVERVVRGIEIEDDPLGRPRVRLQEQGDEQLLDRPPVVADPVVAVERRGRRMLQPVLGLLPASGAQSCAAPRACRPGSPAPGRGAARRDRPGPRNPARGRRCAASAWSRRRARPAPACVRRRNSRPGAPPDRSPGSRPRAAAPRRPSHLSAVERGHHLAPFDGFKSEQIAATLCRHRGTPLRRVKPLSQKSYRRSRAPMHALV